MRQPKEASIPADRHHAGVLSAGTTCAPGTFCIDESMKLSTAELLRQPDFNGFACDATQSQGLAKSS